MKNFNGTFVTVFTEKGYHKAMLPNGEVIPHAVKSIVTDEVGYANARFDFVVNILPTKEDALAKYKEFGLGIKSPWVKAIEEKPNGKGFFKCFGTLNKGTKHEKRTYFDAFYDGDRFVDKDGEDLIGINESVEYWFDFSTIKNPE
jgi:hypothetical protein